MESLDELRALAGELTRAGRFGLRVLADSPAAMRAGIVGLSFSTGPHHARYVPMAQPRPDEGLFSSLGDSEDGAERPGVDRDAALALLKPLLEDESVGKVGHDLKFDAIVLAQHGVTLARSRHRRDDRELPARGQLLAPARGSGDRAHRLQGAHAKKTSAGAAPRPSRSPTSRSNARSTTPASVPTSRCSSRRRCRIF